ncbi:hypothetical protein [Aliiruegeria haliotis]|nr:hypothetical protein [Aliiruegeria haliotis]
MTHAWILDVLADLGAYARRHELHALAEQLDDVQKVAVAECADLSDGRNRYELGKGAPKPADHAGEARIPM